MIYNMCKEVTRNFPKIPFCDGQTSVPINELITKNFIIWMYYDTELNICGDFMVTIASKSC